MAVAVLVGVLAGLAVGLAAGYAVGRAGRGGADTPGLLQRLSEDVDRRLGGIEQQLYWSVDKVQDAQFQAAQSVAEVRERVATVAGVAEQVLEHARGLVRLEDLLRAPQARGGFGEVLLEQLLARNLPAGAYRVQHAFRSGAKVDAVLLLAQGMVPVDSKFPLEAFERMLAAGEHDPARARHRREFLDQVREHVDAIARKYVCPDEGTLDFAFCFLPSDGVYYELLRDDGRDSVFRYAAERRVFAVSPTTLQAYLLSIGIGLRGLQVEANARRVVDGLDRVKVELERFRKAFGVLGKHVREAHASWDEAVRQLDLVEGKFGEVTSSAGELDAARPAAGGEPAAPLTGTG
jgi:DNA recombination protein RmuC